MIPLLYDYIPVMVDFTAIYPYSWSIMEHRCDQPWVGFVSYLCVIRDSELKWPWICAEGELYNDVDVGQYFLNISCRRG